MLKLYLSNFIFWPDLGHHTISGGASSAIKGPQRWICPTRFENKSKKISRDMNFATTSPMGFGAPTLHKPANKSTAWLYHAPSLFAVKSTFAHKYFRLKWKPGTVRSALNGRKYKHFPPVAVFTLILCKLPSLPSIPWFYFPAGCPLLPDMPHGGQHRRGKCVSAFAVPPHPETGHLCCQSGRDPEGADTLHVFLLLL